MITVKTADFEGPFDLFWHLISNKKIDIANVVISEIIDEYLSIIEYEQKENLKIKVEFLAIASELLEIKAYSILSEEKKIEKEQDLEQRILEYKVIKELTEEFSKREIEYNIPYMVVGERSKDADNIFYSIDDLKLSVIQDIFKEFMIRSEKEGSIKINIVDSFTTENALFEIERVFKKEREVSFSKLLSDNFSRGKVVSYFLAILDLFKNGKIDIYKEEDDFIIRKENNV